MFCEQKRQRPLFLFLVTIYFYSCHVGHSVRVKMREGSFIDNPVQESHVDIWERIKRHGPRGSWYSGGHVAHEDNLWKSDRPGVEKPRPKYPDVSENSTPQFRESTPGESSRTLSLHSLFWTNGTVIHVTKPDRTWTSDSEDGYQSDSTGFPGVKGEVFGPPYYSPHFPEWMAMNPVVLCDPNIMTFTASGGGLAHLLVDTGGPSPVSLFHLTPSCGYHLKMSWTDLEMKMPYDACFITQKNGRFVLPLLWWGSPLNLSCPMPPPAPSVFCSDYGMGVQLFEQDMLTLGVKVNGAWGPFVSEECASIYHSSFFFIPITASCITIEDGHYRIWLVIDELEYRLTCPFTPQLPSYPTPYSPGPVTPTTPTPPPHFPTQQQITLHPDNLQYLLYESHLLPFPQIYPPGPQPAHPSIPAPGSPPAPQPQQPGHPYPPLQFPSAVDAFLYPHLYHPYVPYYSMDPSSPTKKTQTITPPVTDPLKPDINLYYLQHFLHHHPFVQMPQPAPHDTQTPAPSTLNPTPPTPVIQPPNQLFSLFYSPSTYSSYYSGQGFYPPAPFDVIPPTTEKPQTVPERPLGFCPSGHPCNYYYPYNPYYPPLHPHLPPVDLPLPPHLPPVGLPVPHHPKTTPHLPTTRATMSVSPQPTSLYTHHKCRKNEMVFYLYSAHMESIQVKDKTDNWEFVLSNAQWNYTLKTAGKSMVILHAPLQTSHIRTPTPTTASLSIRFWNKTTGQYGTRDFECPLQDLIDPTPPSTTMHQASTSVTPQHDVFCSSHKMVVKLPASSMSDIIIKDIKGNKMRLQDAPKKCGYSSSKSNDGRVQLSLSLHSQCHMSVQGTMYIIIVVYMTFDGIRETQFSCPGAVPGTGQECNLPRERRLPCGHGSVSEQNCLSMGCCFRGHPPACYYPMDECTIDRHFIFSVPASLTEPPLSPAQLVAAGNSTCKPEKVTSEYALFKIPMDGCGTHRMQVGKALIYMVEIINMVQTIGHSYGTITRDSPVRLLVECRFLPGTVLTVSYMVKTPTLGPAVQTQGVFGVQLRIAKDAQYSDYYPQYHRPLKMLLGKPLYLELRLLNNPDPSLVLLVHYCVAYPRSGTAFWRLLYKGCPNHLDPTSQVVTPYHAPSQSPKSQIRRFTIETFVFLPDGQFKDPDEEIYFMCSTEICSPRDGPCVEGCFGQ